MAKQIVIRDARTEIVFDASAGGIVSIVDAAFGHWLRADKSPTLFEFETPLPDDRLVVVCTNGQKLASADVDDSGRSVRLVWDALTRSDGEVVDVRAIATVSLDGNGAIEFALELEGAQSLGVEAISYPHLTGIRLPGDQPLSLLTANYGSGQRASLLPVFASTAPYWGTVYPDIASNNLRPEALTNPNAPFAVLDGETRGIVVFPSRPTMELIGWRVSLTPSFLDSLSGLAPQEGVLTFDAFQIPIIEDGVAALQSMTLAPYDGSWESGTQRYEETQLPLRTPTAAWLAEPRSWQQVQVMSTELDARYTFEQLEKIFRECNEAGVGAVQVVGWNEGGQDGRVPVHVPSPKLGGAEGLKRLLTSARELDVKAVLYLKYQWVERPGPYWDEFRDFVIIDDTAQDVGQPGPVYHTARKRYGIRTPRYVPICFGVREVRERFADEVRQIAAWGAAGVLLDESLYHGRALLCFATNHGHKPGASAYEWDNVLIDELRDAVDPIDPEFVIAAEGAYDAQFAVYDISYLRSNSPSHLPLGRYLRPRGARVMTALTGSDDRNMVNQALMYNYVLSYEPRNFKGRLSEIPGTVAYGQAMDAIRSKYARWLWNGTFRGVVGATVTGRDGTPHPTYSTFIDSDGVTVVVVVNYSDEEVEINVDVPGAEDLTAHVIGSDLRASGTTPKVRLAARSAAVVLPTDSLVDS